ncbi:MAG TPA: MgtC/SapB family protein [Gaiellaceae bacterium]
MGPELALWEGFVRLLLAAVLAGLIGLEREYREQEAGLRTHVLVGLGACLFVLTGTFGWSELDFGNDVGINMDPSRVTAYVVTGIGFLGAGAILKYGVNVRGLTTAASLWVVAAIGAASASGWYAIAVATTGIVVASLWPLRQLAMVLGVRSPGAQRLEVQLVRDGSVGAVLAALEEQGVAIESATVHEEPELRRLDLVVRGRGSEVKGLLDTIGRLEGVTGAAWAP